MNPESQLSNGFVRSSERFPQQPAIQVRREITHFPSLRPGSFPGMALGRATTISERGETLVAPFERKGGIAHEAGVSIGRYQIFLNTRCLSGVKCLSDESCSSVVDHSQIHLRGTYSADNVQAVPRFVA